MTPREDESKEKTENYEVVKRTIEERRALYELTRKKLHELFPPSASSSIADAIAEKLEDKTND